MVFANYERRFLIVYLVSCNFGISNNCFTLTIPGTRKRVFPAAAMQRVNPTYRGRWGDDDEDDVDWGGVPSGPMPGFSLNTLVSGAAGATNEWGAPVVSEPYPHDILPGSRLFQEIGAHGQDPVLDLYHFPAHSGALSWPVTRPLTSQDQLIYAKFSGTDYFSRYQEGDHKFRLLGFYQFFEDNHSRSKIRELSFPCDPVGFLSFGADYRGGFAQHCNMPDLVGCHSTDLARRFLFGGTWPNSDWVGAGLTAKTKNIYPPNLSDTLCQWSEVLLAFVKIMSGELVPKRGSVNEFTWKDGQNGPLWSSCSIICNSCPVSNKKKAWAPEHRALHQQHNDQAGTLLLNQSPDIHIGAGNRASLLSGCILPQQVALFQEAARKANGDLASLIADRNAAADRYLAMGLDTMHPWDRLKALGIQRDGYPMFPWFLRIPLEDWFFGDCGLMPAWRSLCPDWGDDLVVPWCSAEIFAGLSFQWAGWWRELFDRCEGSDWDAPGLIAAPELVEGLGGYNWIKVVVAKPATST